MLEIKLSDFNLCGNLEHFVYANNPNDPETLKQNIRVSFYNIQQLELQLSGGQTFWTYSMMMIPILITIFD
jgi:hypothetical protein